jgi:hypothetical protein
MAANTTGESLALTLLTHLQDQAQALYPHLVYHIVGHTHLYVHPAGYKPCLADDSEPDFPLDIDFANSIIRVTITKYGQLRCSANRYDTWSDTPRRVSRLSLTATDCLKRAHDEIVRAVDGYGRPRKR